MQIKNILRDLWTTLRPLGDHWERPLGDHWDTTGTALGDHWETTGRPLGDNWETTGRQMGYHWETTGRPLRTIESKYRTIIDRPLGNHLDPVTPTVTFVEKGLGFLV